MPVLGDILVLDGGDERTHFKATLKGKRVLHIKGFGAGFKSPSSEQMETEAQQKREAMEAVIKFKPDYIVVDGDPWGAGFQIHIKAFAEDQRKSGCPLPALIWAKNVAMSDSEGGQPCDEGERTKRVKQAEQWKEECALEVIVFWVDNAQIGTKMDVLYGEGTTARLEPEKFNKRGEIVILGDSPQAWVSGLGPDMVERVKAMEDPAREDLQYFEKCSFENSAKGNLIYDALHTSDMEAHGVACFGGGESVVLELATKYLNSTSGFDMSSVAVFPHSRGKEDTDPKLPRHVGEAFLQGGNPALAEDSGASGKHEPQGGWVCRVQ